MLSVKPALLFAFLFPPPSAGALGLAGRNCARAWCATDREKTAAMQWTVRNATVAHVRDHPITRPVEQWIHFDELIAVLDRRAGDAVRSRDWSARNPVIHPAAPARARPSGSTLRIAQQACLASTEARKPFTPWRATSAWSPS